jgi:dipeptidyl aminopeptidase/acylaminoacyl peptidase
MRRIKALYLCVLLLSPCAYSETLPLEDFIRHGDYLNIQISPDGKHLAARIRHGETVKLLFIRREDRQAIGGVSPGKNNEIHSATWVSNERVVFQLAQKMFYLDSPVATGELFAVNIDGSQREIIYGIRAGINNAGARSYKKEGSKASHEILSILEQDERKILIIEYPWSQTGRYTYSDKREKPPIISQLDIYNGKKTRIESLPYNGAYALASRDGQINFIGWSDENSDMHASYRKTKDEKWKEVETTFELDDEFLPVAINQEGTKAYFTGPDGEHQIKSMFELDLVSGKHSKVFTNLETDLSGWLLDVDSLEPVVGYTYPNKGKYFYANTQNPLARAHRMLEKAFAGKDISITSRTRDGSVMLVKVDSDINPGEYYLFDINTKNAEFLWANSSWIDPRLMTSMEAIEVKARDGVTLKGYLTLPGDNSLAANTKPHPLVVLPHGGPHSVRDHWEFNPEIQLLANRGYAVLQINFRGSGGYGEVFEKLGYRHWGDDMINDIVDATNWVMEQGYANSDRVCIYGASYGGYAALMSTVRAPDLFKCAIGYVGVYNLEYMHEKGDIPKFWGGSGYLDKVIGRDKQQLQEFSPINHVDKIKAAVMLIHGNNDQRVPIIHAKKMRSELKKAGKNVTWLSYGNSGHGVWDVENRKQLYSGILDFLGKHIGATMKH